MRVCVCAREGEGERERESASLVSRGKGSNVYKSSQRSDNKTCPFPKNYQVKKCLRNASGISTLTPPESRLRRGGILYGQMYSLTKEIIDAARTYPFQNSNLRHLALDSQLRNGVQNICGKATSGPTL